MLEQNPDVQLLIIGNHQIPIATRSNGAICFQHNAGVYRTGLDDKYAGEEKCNIAGFLQERADFVNQGLFNGAGNAVGRDQLPPSAYTFKGVYIDPLHGDARGSTVLFDLRTTDEYQKPPDGGGGKKKGGESHVNPRSMPDHTRK